MASSDCYTCGGSWCTCECERVIPKNSIKKDIDKTGIFKVMREIFLGGKDCIKDNLSYEDAVSFVKEADVDVYTFLYVLPTNVSSKLIYDYDERVG